MLASVYGIGCSLAVRLHYTISNCNALDLPYFGNRTTVSGVRTEDWIWIRWLHGLNMVTPPKVELSMIIMLFQLNRLNMVASTNCSLLTSSCYIPTVNDHTAIFSLHTAITNHHKIVVACLISTGLVTLWWHVTLSTYRTNISRIEWPRQTTG